MQQPCWLRLQNNVPQREDCRAMIKDDQQPNDSCWLTDTTDIARMQYNWLSTQSNQLVWAELGTKG